MEAMIFDCDGTLSDPSARLFHVQTDPKNWNGFFEAMHEDPPIYAVAKLAQICHAHAMRNRDVAVLVVTARPDDANYKQVTIDWLAANGITYDKLYMRKGGDYRADHVVKAEILQQIIEDGFLPILAVDDRPSVVEVWRSYGITTLQCAPDETRSLHEGKTLLHMMVGPAGSGKSTYCMDNYKPSEVIYTDAIRAELFGDEPGVGHRPEELALTWKYAHGLVKTRLDCGLLTVLDATNLKRKDRMAVLKQVPKGVVVQYVVIDRDLDDKLKDRGWRPVDLIMNHHKTFKSQLKDILNADDQANVVVIDKRK